MVALTAALLAGVVATSSASEDSGQWVSPADFFGEAHHNGGTKERLILPAGGKKPHIWMLLFGIESTRPVLVCPRFFANRSAFPSTLAFVLAFCSGIAVVQTTTGGRMLAGTETRSDPVGCRSLQIRRL